MGDSVLVTTISKVGKIRFIGSTKFVCKLFSRGALENVSFPLFSIGFSEVLVSSAP